MDGTVRTNPTSTITAKEFAEIVQPPQLEGLSADETAAALETAECRAQDLARRLGINKGDGRLPAYIWAIVFAQDDA